MNDMSSVRADIKPGIYEGIPNEAYHAGPGISKSGLWTIHTQTPAHYKFGERVTSAAFDLGEACHLAILQPELFETQVVRGPDDRRGNKWKDIAEACQIEGKLLLTSGDYDASLAIRDAVHADAWINSIITGGKPLIEASAYWTDPTTGVLCRCRPDLYREDLGIILDVKTTTSAHPGEFGKSVANYGYHAQEAFYSDGMRANRKPVEGFVFLAWEKKSPYAKSVFELPPAIVEEGRAICKAALRTYATCQRGNHWPAYAGGVQELTIPRWAYKLTPPPSGLDDAEAAA